ncbi:ATP-binding protein [Paraburkholderia saeva]|uniref:histidine kinase n=1 Tax=Paraburkholderia saeva TaxID=2777537 RepID=A0A9N8S0K5_9BURK|nr:ATP-binding protein [Paraburkholderia saeva]CAG4894406.1 Sensor histidine kinase RcsC [Paraburkholderia saeva]CAG4917417.1 Sensor histidine kinase RcsC [Paraburkholderia saeva]
MTLPVLTLVVSTEQDLVAVRRRAHEISSALGFGQQDRARIATAVLEIARNALAFANGGRVSFEVEGSVPPQLLTVRIADAGPGMPDPASMPAGGLVAAQRLMDQCLIDSAPGAGTTVILKKAMPERAPVVTADTIESLTARLDAFEGKYTYEELQRQNRELLAALTDLHERQDELTRLTRELEDTNRGVVALYAELDERADHLRRADNMKSRFLSNMSHEFRTPLSSIRALSKLLLDRIDGELTTEQEKQVRYIRKAADDLSEIVNDLLDLAKIESGKIEIRAAEFEIDSLFSALRGMMRPLLADAPVELIFEPCPDSPPIYNDEAKVAQILRNFVSNALKFTEKGEVRVSAAYHADTGMVTFCVADTGIGIASEHLQLIFEEFGQVENRLQNAVKGTGLGLPLCAKLCALLGGSLSVDSTEGRGSVFSATLPIYFGQATDSAVERETLTIEAGKRPILVIEDEPEVRLLYESWLRNTDYQAVSVKNLREADQMMKLITPNAIVLDLLLGEDDTWRWLMELKAGEYGQRIPIIVATAVNESNKGKALGADAYLLKPITRSDLMSSIDRLVDPQEEDV